MRRTKIETIYDILVTIKAEDGRVRPTRLLYKSNLSHNKMMEYLSELMEKGMVYEEEEKGKKYYVITEKGVEFTSEYRRMRNFLGSFGF